MNDGTGLQYFLTDHLGSVVATTDSNGTLTSKQRYLPFGGVRADVPSPDAPDTDYGYTGQRNLDAGIGLMDYKARFYSPYLNRFVQPDTLIPSPANPQAFNRYTYVMNSPVNFNDPTGHMCSDPDDDTGFCEGSANVKTKVGDKMISGNGKNPGLGSCGGFGQKKCRTSRETETKIEPSTNNLQYQNVPDFSNPPINIILHPLDGNTVSQEPIFDYSYRPPKIVGYRIASYAYDDWHVDVGGFLFPNFSDPVSSTEFGIQVAKDLLKPGLKNLETIGFSLACATCGVVARIGFSIYEVNQNITFDAHFRIHDVYFQKSPFETPFNYLENLGRVQ